MTTIQDTKFWPVLSASLSAFQAALQGNDNPPANYRIVPGVIPVEDLSATADLCCEGMAWVRQTGAYPTASFPTQLDAANQLCADPPSWAVQVELGCYRCVSMGDLNQMPTDSDWQNAAIQVTNDEEAMRVAARVMQQMAPFGAPVPVLNMSFLMGAWEPVEVQGGCVGGKLAFTIQVMCPE